MNSMVLSQRDRLHDKHLSSHSTQNTTVTKTTQQQISKEKLDQQQQDFRNAMSHLAAAVNIVTTDGSAGRAGFTASAICSVTDTPPTLLVCLNRKSSVYEIFKENQVLCVNTLAVEHQALSHVFGGKTPMSERFEQANWQRLVTGSPVLNDAMLAFDCKVTQITSVGTHDILFCEVQHIQHMQGARSLIYFNRAYHQLSPYG